jgi:hypothetical protein
MQGLSNTRALPDSSIGPAPPRPLLTARQRCVRARGRVVEEAEAAELHALGVVAGRPHRREGAGDGPVQNGVHGLAGGGCACVCVCASIQSRRMHSEAGTSLIHD